MRMGRPREKNKHMPSGMRLVDGRWYWRPTNEPTRALRDKLFPGRSSVPAGGSNDTNDGARQWWGETILPAIKEASPVGLPKEGTVAEIIERYERDVLPTLESDTEKEQRRHCNNLKKAFGTRRYARSEAEASTGPYLRSIDITRYLADQETTGRPVQGNKEIHRLSRIFRLAKTRWGYTEYNPCLQVEYNPETPRSLYVTDTMFNKVYPKASPEMQCMMDLAQMHAARRGMLLKAMLVCITEEGLLLPLNKKKKTDQQRYQLIRWSDELRAVIARALELRAKVRGAQKDVKDLDTAPLFLNRKGKAWTKTGFNSQWHRATRTAGFKKNEFHFHDIKAKSVSDSPNELDAQNRGGHLDPRTTRRVYRRKPVEVIPLPQVSKKIS